MKERRKKRLEKIESIFKIYNGSAVTYHTQKPSNKSIQQICSMGATIAFGTSVNSLLNEVRK